MLQHPFWNDFGSADYHSGSDTIVYQRPENHRPVARVGQSLSFSTPDTLWPKSTSVGDVEYLMHARHHFPGPDPGFSWGAVVYGHTRAWQNYLKMTARSSADPPSDSNVTTDNSLVTCASDHSTWDVEAECTTQCTSSRPVRRRADTKKSRKHSEAMVGLDSKRLICPIMTHAETETRTCDRKFLRPEHLKRHMLTVHDEHRKWPCKVPQCHKRFSRRDNLREHYWTHVDKGDRRGRNAQWSLEELTQMLYPEEASVCIRLEKRLQQYRATNDSPRRERKRRSRWGCLS